MIFCIKICMWLRFYFQSNLPIITQLCYLSLKDIWVELAPDEHDRAKKSFMWNIWHVQLDSHLGASPFKVALYPTADDDKKRDGKHQKCFFGVKAELFEHPTNWIFDLLSINLAPMQLRLDLRLVESLTSLAAAYTEVDSVKLVNQHDPFPSGRCIGECERTLPAGQEGLRALSQLRFSESWNFDPTSAEAVQEVLRLANNATTYLYFRVFKISEMSATVSIRKALFDSRDVPIKFQSVQLVQRSFQGSSELLSLLKDYYSRDMNRQKPKLFGSLTALGNFPGLIQNVSIGGRNFFAGIGNGFKQVFTCLSVRLLLINSGRGTCVFAYPLVCT